MSGSSGAQRAASKEISTPSRPTRRKSLRRLAGKRTRISGVDPIRGFQRRRAPTEADATAKKESPTWGTRRAELDGSTELGGSPTKNQKQPFAVLTRAFTLLPQRASP